MDNSEKAESIVISVSRNGYVVENPVKGDYGRFQSHQSTWAFESMKELQRRLPEILDVPHEKRVADKPKATK